MYNGISYTSFSTNGFTQGNKSNEISKMIEHCGTNALAINVFEWLHDADDKHFSQTGGTSSLDDIRAAVKEAQRYNIATILKPNIDVVNGTWRAFITPDDNSVWFEMYTDMILKYARLAEELGVDVLSIGTELVAATQPRFEKEWRLLIASIRSVYRGLLVYCANWSGNSAIGINEPEYATVPFWDAMDYIGIDTYIPLTQIPTDTIPSRNNAKKILTDHCNDIGRIADKYDKPVLITECGIQSVDGALASPWEYMKGRFNTQQQNTHIQEFYYSVLLETFHEYSWCAGLFWWNWGTTPSGYHSTDYSPFNKPAAKILKESITNF